MHRKFSRYINIMARDTVVRLATVEEPRHTDRQLHVLSK